MDFQFFCPGCRSDHREPAEAHLGYRLLCVDCALESELIAYASIRPDLSEHSAERHADDPPLAA